MSTGERNRLLAVRARIEEKPALRLAYRIAVGVIGTAVLVLGIILIPYPGPGWLVVFAGLAVLGSEFEWAKRTLRYAKGKYDDWTEWLGRQSLPVKLGVLTLTALVVIATLWLLNAFYLVAGWVGLEGWTWLRSPLFA